MEVEAYSRQLRQLLPQGSLWNFEPDSWLSKTLLALAGEFARLDVRGQNLLDEWDPRTALELLEDWERVLALPDSCLTSIPTAITDRRRAITQKLTSRGGQRPQFYIDLAATLGLAVSITEFHPCRVGARVGDRCQDLPWAHAWLMNVPLGTAPGVFRAGDRAGDRLGLFDSPDLECLVQRASPAHTDVLFGYS